MAWHRNKQWDRFTTPPGASTADLSTIISQICIAINQRRAHISTDGYGDSVLSAVNWPVNSDLSVSLPLPTASDFDCSIHGKCTKYFLEHAPSQIQSLLGISEDNFIRSFSGGTPARYWTYADLWAEAGTGLPAYDATKALFAPNYIRLANALDLLKNVTMSIAMHYDEYSATIVNVDCSTADAATVGGTGGTFNLVNIPPGVTIKSYKGTDGWMDGFLVDVIASAGTPRAHDPSSWPYLVTIGSASGDVTTPAPGSTLKRIDITGDAGNLITAEIQFTGACSTDSDGGTVSSGSICQITPGNLLSIDISTLLDN